MELKEILHMKEGDGEFSYAHNSISQAEVASMNKSIIDRVIRSLFSEGIVKEYEVLKVADLGCGVGAVPLALISSVVENVQMYKWEDDNQMPDIEIYLNDLPSNDFNLLFRDLLHSELPKRGNGMPFCFMLGAPGSFYGPLFPWNNLHFVHSNFSLHWLSQVPPDLYTKEGMPVNKGNINISDGGPPAIARAYLAQFQQDWTFFLHCRSQEAVLNGYMLLTALGRPSIEARQPTELELLGQAIDNLVSRGLIKEDKLDSFNFPSYCPSTEEITDVVKKEGSFTIEHLETLTTHFGRILEDRWAMAETTAKGIRAFSEHVVSHHFGLEIWNVLYNELVQVTYKHLSKESVKCFVIVMLLRNKIK